MSNEPSISSDNTEITIRTAFVYVPAISPLRSLSGNFFAPTGFSRVRSHSNIPIPPAPEVEATAGTSSDSNVPTPSNK